MLQTIKAIEVNTAYRRFKGGLKR